MTASPSPVLDGLRAQATDLDARDPLAGYLEEFVPAPGVTAYLDGNSLGRPVRSTADHLSRFVADEWGTRLIRSWDEGWMDTPTVLGDRIARIALGAAGGQTVVADSTTVMLYKLLHAAVTAMPGRDEIVVERANFPTDRFVAESVAAQTGATLRWLETDPIAGVQLSDIDAAVSERTAVVVLSHVDYRSAALADMAGITAAVHRHGALMLWDLCHSAGAVPMELDTWGVDLAVGCGYKYLNGGPGSPAFAYVRAELHDRLRQPIQGWMGAADVFAMKEGYAAAPGIRQFISGTPPVLAMVPLSDMLDLVERASIDAIRRKSVSLTGLVVDAYDRLLAPRGVRLLSPADPAQRGGHVSFGHASFREVTRLLWRQGVIPDFRFPDGIRVGLSPLSISHREALEGVIAIHAAMDAQDAA
ncbi:aminotransferase class V-fold PLP-dependent enzyme [Microbacterium caowuchunii]|uniref:kynureninase n=1 Tax=Microbacterium caowuchunii TaxID=2614638 RepID=UPI0012476274|nr:aminotransferase class V-fold PLP-dependent enzyme [Microbacterium caowuchunii]QEW01245.1 aminotransferase class V-fold PLP-dependent enzyme [Microbacterium caowuchunii]